MEISLTLNVRLPSWCYISWTKPIFYHLQNISLFLCPSASISIYLLSLPALCLWDGLIETCIIHLRVLSVIAESSPEQRGAKQNYNQSTGVWHPAQWDMLIGCHRISMQMEKCSGLFCKHWDCLESFSKQLKLVFIGILLLSQWNTQTTCLWEHLMLSMIMARLQSETVLV